MPGNEEGTREPGSLARDPSPAIPGMLLQTWLCALCTGASHAAWCAPIWIGNGVDGGGGGGGGGGGELAVHTRASMGLAQFLLLVQSLQPGIPPILPHMPTIAFTASSVETNPGTGRSAVHCSTVLFPGEHSAL